MGGPQFIATDFKKFMKLVGMKHVRAGVSYPQSNGKVELWHKTMKSEAILRRVPLSLEESRKVAAEYVDDYNNVRLNSGINCVTLRDRLEGRQGEIWRERDRKLEEAREKRRIARQSQRAQMISTQPIPQNSMSR